MPEIRFHNREVPTFSIKQVGEITIFRMEFNSNDSVTLYFDKEEQVEVLLNSIKMLIRSNINLFLSE